MLEEARTKEPDEIFCSNCGAVIKKGIQFCSHCGTRIGSGPADAQTAAPPRTSPASAQELNTKGQRLLIQGKLDEALAALGQAIVLAPDYVNAYLNRAEVLEKLGRTAEAQADRQTAGALAASIPAGSLPGSPGGLTYPGRGAVVLCANCGQPAGDGRFCRFCDHGLLPGQTGLKLTSFGQRIGTHFLDVLISIFTLVVGWLIWFAIVAPKGQTPGMNLLKIHCVDETGATASAGTMWLRQAVYVGLVYTLVGSFTSGVGGVIGYCWAFWDKDRQTLHDKMARTFVVDGEPAATTPG
jgi:uncharacterized RDD family membrane protein YckC